MVSKKEGVEQLRQVPLFSDLSTRDLGRLWDRVKLVEHRQGHTIVTEGRPGHGFHLLLEGTVKVERKNTRVALGPGEFFGEMSLIDQGPRTATVTTTSPVVAATLSSGEFRSWAKKHPEVLWKLLVFVTGRLRAEQSVTANMTA
jgi:CRP-like cAMP-binding protein